MRFRHWYWIFILVLFINGAINGFASGQMLDIAFAYLSIGLSLHAVWMLMIGHASVFEREYWESIKSGIDGDG